MWADKLSAVRRQQASILEKAIENGLKDLNFEDVNFQIHFEQKR